MSDFAEFMRECLKRHGKKKVDVARGSGISDHYVYKILAGHKRPGERDYVIAMCRAAEMDIRETDLALSANSMSELNPYRSRDSIILRCIADNRNVRMTNQSLEDAGMEQLRVRFDV